MAIVITIERSRGIEWETRQSCTVHAASRRGDLHALRGVMVTEYYLDLPDDTGQIGITGLRCTSCGEVVDPGGADVEDQNGHGNDTQPGD